MESQKPTRQWNPLNKEAVNDALKLLEVARSDFEAAKLLMDNRKYPQGLFLLQQSLEKMIKSIIRALDAADMEELKKDVGHKASKTLEIMFYNLLDKINKYLNELLNQISKINILKVNINKILNLNEINKIFNNAKNEFKKEVLDKIKGYVEKIGEKVFSSDEDSVKKLNEVIDKVTWDVMHGLAKEILNSSKPILSMLTFIPQFRNDIKFEDLLIRILYLIDIYALLLVFHMMFESNVSRFRYPEGDWTPLYINDDMVIVRAAKDIINVLEKIQVFDVMRDFIDINRDIEPGSRGYEVYKQLQNFINEALRLGNN